MKGAFTRTSKLLEDYATNLMLKTLEKKYFKFILSKFLRVFIFMRRRVRKVSFYGLSHMQKNDNSYLYKK